jgi:putative transposase
LIDLCDLDEAGFSMTLANAYSWSLVGKRLSVRYEAPEGRRVNAVGALFHGTRRFAFATRARVPKTKRKAISLLAMGLDAAEIGTLDGEALVSFIWRIAGRPEEVPADWRREKPLVIVLDNYSVHKGKRFKEEMPKWEEAGIGLFYLPSYSPELSAIEPLWRDVKQHRMRRLSRPTLVELKRDVDEVLQAKANRLVDNDNSLNNST